MVQLKLIQKYAPWSPSKSTLAATCPLAFKFRYIDHAPAGPRGIAGVVGVIVHRAQELVLLKTHTAADALTHALEENQEPLTDKDIKQVRGFEDALQAFAARIDKFHFTYPIREVLLERKWAVRQDFTPCAFDADDAMMRGIVDLALVLESGQVIIIDHKTGKRRPASYYKPQLDIYSVFALSHVPDLTAVQCALHYVAHRKLEWSDPIKQPFIRNLLRPWLHTYLYRRAERAETQKASPGKHCDWCDYREICPSRGMNNVVETGAGSGEIQSGAERASQALETASEPLGRAP